MGRSELLSAANGAFDSESEQFFETGAHPRLPGVNSALYRLFALNASMRGEGTARERLLPAMQHAKHFLDSMTAADIIDDLIFDEGASRALASAISHLEHVGLIVPESLAHELPWATAAAGFRLRSTTAPSVIVAQELGALEGKASIPTKIFKAFARGYAGTICLEAFIPSFEPEVVDSWVERNVGTHVGMCVKDPAALGEMKRIFGAAGYVVPAFMNGGPLINRAENVALIYFDGQLCGQQVRIECCCYDVL